MMSSRVALLAALALASATVFGQAARTVSLAESQVIDNGWKCWNDWNAAGTNVKAFKLEVSESFCRNECAKLCCYEQAFYAYYAPWKACWLKRDFDNGRDGKTQKFKGMRVCIGPW